VKSFNKYPSTFSPISVGKIELKNRILLAPMAPCLAGSESGEVTPEAIAYFAQQARSGAALCTIGGEPVDHVRARDAWSNISVIKEANIPDLQKISDTVHELGAKVCCELCHSGMNSNPMSLLDKALVPSLLPDMDPSCFEEIGQAQIEEVIESFAACGRRLKSAGFDMILIHAAHGNLVSAFFSNTWNKRTDEYGGNLENRMRFTLALLKRLRQAVGNDMAIDMRISAFEYSDDCPTEAEVITFINRCAEYIDMVNFSGGSTTETGSERLVCSYLMPKNINVERVARMRPQLKIPVSVVGNIQNIEDIEEIIASGQADMVTLGRTALADSEFARKAYQGRTEQIRPCLRCNMCGKRPFFGLTVRCAINPSLGRETKVPTVADTKKRVMVVGGGPAGMTIAQLLSAKRGHEVLLYEQSAELGGRLHEASAMRAKEPFRKYLDWTVRETKNSGVDIHLNTSVDEAIIRAVKPDTLVLAIGAEHIIPCIKGIENADAITVTEADLRLKPIGQRVVIVGAGASGLEASIDLALEGHEVSVVDLQKEELLLTEYFPNIPSRLKQLQRENGVAVHYETKVVEFAAGALQVELPDGSQKPLPCDTVILAIGLRPDQETLSQLTQIVPETYIIGDADKVGDIMAANTQAYIISMEV
jgi:2,4-dienoyl-CoA reductase-like NADH-dependent reductase (Old Yellow Enzyme family)/thioredoxin reductase